jgi:hypothetical protein
MLSLFQARNLSALCVLASVFSFLTLPATGAVNQRKIKVLIVDGFSNHDWRQTTALLRGILEPTGLFEVSVSTAPPTAATSGWEQWRPKFDDYDVVIQTCNDIGGGPSWPREIQMAFENYVRNGGGVLVFHSGNNAFSDWSAYNRMIGLGWRGKDQGDAITIERRNNPGQEKIVRIPSGQGENTGHDSRFDVVVHRLGGRSHSSWHATRMEDPKSRNLLLCPRSSKKDLRVVLRIRQTYSDELAARMDHSIRPGPGLQFYFRARVERRCPTS